MSLPKVLYIHLHDKLTLSKATMATAKGLSNCFINYTRVSLL